MIAVTFALPAESSAFIRRLKDTARSGRNRGATVTGTLHGKAVCVSHTGVGEKAARAHMSNFMEHQAPMLLISAGFAGGVHEDLRVGDLIVAENFSARGLVDSARGAIGPNLRIGKLATNSGMVDSAPKRRELARHTGAIAVDMETEFIARACAERRLPVLSLRVISDTAAEPLPAPPGVLFDMTRQKTSARTLLAHVARHPLVLVRLVRFARRIARARQTLARALAAVIRES
jgi:nucleoside phosphorylase